MFELICYSGSEYGEREENAIMDGNYSSMKVSEEDWARVCESLHFATINFVTGHNVNIKENGQLIYQADTQNMPTLEKLMEHRIKRDKAHVLIIGCEGDPITQKFVSSTRFENLKKFVKWSRDAINIQFREEKQLIRDQMHLECDIADETEARADQYLTHFLCSKMSYYWTVVDEEFELETNYKQQLDNKS